MPERLSLNMQFTAPRWIADVWPRRQPLNPNFEHSVLPSYGTVYLNHLVGEFESLMPQLARTVIVASDPLRDLPHFPFLT